MMKRAIQFLIIFLILLQQSASNDLYAQLSPILNAAEIQLSLKKLSVIGSALYIAAHPDDENTAVLAYLSKEKMVRTGYLSLTRGSGGQNLIGNEKGRELGVLRTQELLAARKIDGAEQFFTRAIDFGYSKTAKETLAKWNREEILSDIVWIIRQFQPDIIITRFTEQKGGHGHHLSSAILAKEAFFAAADSTRFRNQLKFVSPWQTKRLLWNAWRPQLENRTPQMPSLVSIDLGTYNPLLGKSYVEFSALSRSMHKSQGFGSSGYRGSYINYFEHIAGQEAQHDLFEDIDLSWRRMADHSNISLVLDDAYRNFDPNDPQEILPLLTKAYSIMENMEKSSLLEVKLIELKEVIRSCLGLWLEAVSDEYVICPEDTLPLQIMAVNRSDFPLILKGISLPFAPSESALNQQLEYNKPYKQGYTIKLPSDSEITHPYWLTKKAKSEIYNIQHQQDIGKPQIPSPLKVIFQFQIHGNSIKYNVPIYHRWTDRVRGELYRPVEISPAVTTNLPANVFIFPNKTRREIQLNVKCFKANSDGKIKINLPRDWKARPSEIPFSFSHKFEESSVKTTIIPPLGDATGDLQIEIETGNKHYSQSMTEISHDHIPIQILFPPAQAKLVHLKINTPGKNIGYVMGSGDEIPECLQQIGYSVSLLSDEALDASDLSDYDAIITGTRAYNTRPRLQYQKNRLFEYVYHGGTLITLHNTRFGLPATEIGPYPFKISRGRVSVEQSPVTFLKPDHPILNRPNKITVHDFAGWVQERGLYFADEWASHYTPILASNDPGETPKEGGLLYTKYGKGYFIYSGYSWFRQLPAGVPGAYRLFVNMISSGQK